MKNRIFATTFSLALLTAAAGFAQSSKMMEADIPFAFHVGTTVLPAGHYTVRPEIANGILAIRGLAGGVMIMAERTEARSAPSTGSLVFNRYAGVYFLSKVWSAGTSAGRALPKSPAERELAHLTLPFPEEKTVLARR